MQIGELNHNLDLCIFIEELVIKLIFTKWEEKKYSYEKNYLLKNTNSFKS